MREWQIIASDNNQMTGILAVLGDGSVPSNVEEITTLRLTFAISPEFQIRDFQLLVVPEPGGLALLAIGFIAPLMRFRVKPKSIVRGLDTTSRVTTRRR